MGICANKIYSDGGITIDNKVLFDIHTTRITENLLKRETNEFFFE